MDDDDGTFGVSSVVGRLEVGMTKYLIVVGNNKIGRDSKCEKGVVRLSTVPAQQCYAPSYLYLYLCPFIVTVVSEHF